MEKGNAYVFVFIDRLLPLKQLNSISNFRPTGKMPWKMPEEELFLYFELTIFRKKMRKSKPTMKMYFFGYLGWMAQEIVSKAWRNCKAYCGGRRIEWTGEIKNVSHVKRKLNSKIFVSNQSQKPSKGVWNLIGNENSHDEEEIKILKSERRAIK